MDEASKKTLRNWNMSTFEQAFYTFEEKTKDVGIASYLAFVLNRSPSLLD